MVNSSISSDFIVPSDFSSEWRDILLTQTHSRTLIYTATRYDRRYLLKTLSPEIASLTDYRLQQEQEFQLAVQLVHPNIAATYSLEEISGVGRCIVQEWIDGVTLGEWLQTKPSRAAKERVLNQLLDALDYIHGLQLVHHDLKADNILITRNGTNVKLIDFGLSAIDATLSPVNNDPQKDIESVLKIFPDICPKGHFANIAALRKAIYRRKRFVRLLPAFLSLILLAAAICFFYISWRERQIEQQRYEAMSAQIESYMAQEYAALTEIVNRRESYDRTKPEDIVDYQACFADYSAYIQSRWIIRDSLFNLYDESDPMRERFWQMWNRREAEMNNELLPILTAKF